MPVIYDDNGNQIGFACVRGRARRRACWQCSSTAPLLCDGTRPGKKGTCDRPMCHAHAKHVGPDRDLCSDCSRQAELPTTEGQ